MRVWPVWKAKRTHADSDTDFLFWQSAMASIGGKQVGGHQGIRRGSSISAFRVADAEGGGGSSRESRPPSRASSVASLGSGGSDRGDGPEGMRKSGGGRQGGDTKVVKRGGSITFLDDADASASGGIHENEGEASHVPHKLKRQLSNASSTESVRTGGKLFAPPSLLSLSLSRAPSGGSKSSVQDALDRSGEGQKDEEDLRSKVIPLTRLSSFGSDASGGMYTKPSSRKGGGAVHKVMDGGQGKWMERMEDIWEERFANFAPTGDDHRDVHMPHDGMDYGGHERWRTGESPRGEVRALHDEIETMRARIAHFEASMSEAQKDRHDRSKYGMTRKKISRMTSSVGVKRQGAAGSSQACSVM